MDHCLIPDLVDRITVWQSRSLEVVAIKSELYWPLKESFSPRRMATWMANLCPPGVVSRVAVANVSESLFTAPFFADVAAATSAIHRLLNTETARDNLLVFATPITLWKNHSKSLIWNFSRFVDKNGSSFGKSQLLNRTNFGKSKRREISKLVICPCRVVFEWFSNLLILGTWK